MVLVPYADCVVPNSGSNVVLLGPWLPMAIPSIAGTVWTDCVESAVAVSGGSAVPTALSECSETSVAVTGGSFSPTAVSDCAVPLLGLGTILMGPWLPMGLIAGFTDCALSAVAITGGSATPTAISACSVPLTVWKDCDPLPPDTGSIIYYGPFFLPGP